MGVCKRAKAMRTPHPDPPMLLKRTPSRFRRIVSLLAFVLVAFSAFAAATPAAPFQRVANCVWKADRWNDGDSFHAIVPNGNPMLLSKTVEVIVRLYFVDTPEAETKYAERIAEQAAYFGISDEQSLEVAKEASAFTEKSLAKPFTLWTRGSPAMGISSIRRIYSFVVTADGKDLNAALVSEGLVRIKGSGTPLPNGKTAKEYLAQLRDLEAQAKAAKRGGWRFAPKPAKPAVAPTGPALPANGIFASKRSAVFHKADCKSVAAIFAANLVNFGTRQEAVEAGKKPCSICQP